MSSIAESLTITSQATELDRVLAWLEQSAINLSLSDRNLFQLDLVLNEALPNILSYAYLDQACHEISINLSMKDDVIVLEIIDDGVPFNPLSVNSSEQALSLEFASINGRGINLMKSFTDAQEYQRIDGSNVLRLSILKTNHSVTNEPLSMPS